MPNAARFSYFQGPHSTGDAVRWNGSVTLDLTWVNDGGPAHGCALVLWGSAIVDGLVRITSATTPGPGTNAHLAAVVARHPISDGATFEKAVFAELDVPGNPDWDAPDTTGVQIGMTMVRTRIGLRVEAAGRGSLSLALVPTDAATTEDMLELDVTTVR